MSKDMKREWDNEAFRSDLGHKAQIERHDEIDKTNANMELQKIGHNIKASTEALREHEYLGSIAVHYYKTPMLGQPAYVSQPGAIGKVPEHLVQHGITDLRNCMLEMFGQSTQRKRSGF